MSCHGKRGVTDPNVAIEAYGVVDSNFSDNGLKVSPAGLTEGGEEFWPIHFAHGKELTVSLRTGKRHESSLTFVGSANLQAMIDWSSPGIGLVKGGTSGYGFYVVPSFIKGCQ